MTTTLRLVTFWLFIASFLSDSIVLLTMNTFRPLHKGPTIRVMECIHTYDALSSLVYACSFYFHGDSFACHFEAIVTNVFQVLSFFWVTILSMKLYYAVFNLTSHESSFWNRIGTDWRVHIASFTFIVGLTLVPLEQSRELGIGNVYVQDENYICWLNGDMEMIAYFAYNIVTFYLYLIVAFVISIYCLFRSFAALTSIDMDPVTKKRLHRLLLYPIVFLLIFIPAGTIDLSNHSAGITETASVLIFSLSGILYSTVYWISNRKSRTAWYLLYLDIIDPRSPGADGKRVSRIAQSFTEEDSAAIGPVFSATRPSIRKDASAHHEPKGQDEYGSYIDDMDHHEDRLSSYLLRLTDASVNENELEMPTRESNAAKLKNEVENGLDVQTRESIQVESNSAIDEVVNVSGVEIVQPETSNVLFSADLESPRQHTGITGIPSPESDIENV